MSRLTYALLGTAAILLFIRLSIRAYRFCRAVQSIRIRRAAEASEDCQSMCDCDEPPGDPHSEECRTHRVCGESGLCDVHFDEADEDSAYLMHVAKYAEMPVDQEYFDGLRNEVPPWITHVSPSRNCATCS